MQYGALGVLSTSVHGVLGVVGVIGAHSVLGAYGVLGAYAVWCPWCPSLAGQTFEEGKELLERLARETIGVLGTSVHGVLARCSWCPW